MKRSFLYFIAALFLSYCGRNSDQSSSLTQRDDILLKLRALPGVTVEEETTDIVGYRRFQIKIDQPTDHANPGGEHFKQKLVLLHKSEEAPLVLQTSGYSIFKVKLSSPALTFGANQIQVEHRFFSDSIPASKDFSKVDIFQSAQDFHAITQTFKTIYRGKWVNTGGSKGGMTSVFHKRYFPGDLDGTLALVAPLSFSTSDSRYVTWVRTVGGDPQKICRDKLLASQKVLLSNRDQILAAITQGTYNQLGTKEIAFEHAVIEMSFVFWQYHAPDDATCSNVPDASAPVAKHLKFLADMNDATETSNAIEGYSDEGMEGFVTYYYQASRQLGAPASDLESLQGFLKFPETYNLDRYVPADLPRGYDPGPMINVDQWVQNESEHIMFIYGGFDPWTAGAFHPNQDAASDSHFYVKEAGNHRSSDFLTLPDQQKAEATRIISEWLGVQTPEPSRLRMATDIANAGQSLEAQEHKLHHRGRL